MQPVSLDPSSDPISESAPTDRTLTLYDRQHLTTYLRLLDADARGASWQEVARNAFKIDPALEPDRARRIWHTHLTRARWINESGYRHLLYSSFYQ